MKQTTTKASYKYTYYVGPKQETIQLGFSEE